MWEPLVVLKVVPGVPASLKAILGAMSVEPIGRWKSSIGCHTGGVVAQGRQWQQAWSVGCGKDLGGWVRHGWDRR